MDSSWMKANRLNKEYENGVIQFLESTGKNLSNDNEIFWRPCKICRNMQKHQSVVVLNNLGCD